MQQLQNTTLNTKKTAWQICKLGYEDIAQVVALEKECFTLPWNAQNYAQALNQNVFELYGIKSNETLFCYISYYHLGEEIEIINIATSPFFRRQGYAGRLLGFVLEQARKQAKGRVLLEVRETNIPAIGLYKSVGFCKVGRRKKYYFDTGEDALVYELKLNSAE